MAYARYSRTCPWYVFWYASSTTERDQERLAIWHVDHHSCDERTPFTYAEVVGMLSKSDLTPIVGFTSDQFDFLRPLLEEFLHDVDEEYS